MEGCAEGQRWSGRTQTYVSSSPKQQTNKRLNAIWGEMASHPSGSTWTEQSFDSIPADARSQWDCHLETDQTVAAVERYWLPSN
jgi:hypothetical protein